jgi:hypothetical protein
MNIKFSNWQMPTHAGIAMASGIVGSITAFMPQFLSVLHEAPFPIATLVDDWINWIFKLATVTLGLLSIFYKKTGQ